MDLARIGVFGVLAAILIACGTSNVANDAPVSVSGTLALADGNPASGVTVGLIEEPDGISALVELTVTVTTVGLLCLTQTVAICKGSRKTTTDAEGRYTFKMNGSDSKNILGNPARFAVSAQLPSGAQVQTRFEISTATIAVPKATFWEPEKLSATPGPQSVEYSFSEFRSKPKPKGYQVSVTDSVETIWAQPGSPSGKFDARAVADAKGELHVVATVQQKVEEVTFTTTHHSPRIPLAGAAGAPPSRGATCEVAGATGPVPLTPCPFTDGTYSGPFPSRSCPQATPTPSSPKRCTANSWISVDLGTARPISAVFLHGLGMSSDTNVETSDDGRQWTKRAKQKPAQFLMLTMPAGTSARYVRVRSGNETDSIYGLTELSIW